MMSLWGLRKSLPWKGEEKHGKDQCVSISEEFLGEEKPSSASVKDPSRQKEEEKMRWGWGRKKKKKKQKKRKKEKKPYKKKKGDRKKKDKVKGRRKKWVGRGSHVCRRAWIGGARG